MHFEAFGADRGFDGGEQAGVIDGAQRLPAFRRGRDHGLGSRVFGESEQFPEHRISDGGHVASDHQIPLSELGRQCSVQAAQRTTSGDPVRNDRKPKFSIDFPWADQGGASGSLENFARNRLNQSGAFPGQESLIAAHPRAAASGQHESGSAACGSALHEKMVAIVKSTPANKKVYICFITALAMAASPLSAAGAERDPSASKVSSQKTLVVRADRRTGKLVRSVAPLKTSQAAKPAPAIDVAEIVDKAARDNHVDPLLVHSIIQVESNYNPYAVSSKGAQGLMQLMPPTARDLGVNDSFDPRQNIEAGVRYLKYLQDLYKDDRLALAAYNAGPGAVEKYKWIPPYPETQDYVNRVGQQYGAAKKAAAQYLAEPAAPPVGVTEEKHPKLEPFVDAEGRLHLRTTQQ